MARFNQNFTVFVDVRAGALSKKLKFLRDRFGKEVADATRESALYTKNYAAKLAPYDTGQTSQKIISAITYNNQGRIGAVIGYKELPHPEARWGTQQFNLPWWFAFSKIPLRYNYGSKNPRYMILAQVEARKKFPETVKFKVSKLLKESFSKGLKDTIK